MLFAVPQSKDKFAQNLRSPALPGTCARGKCASGASVDCAPSKRYFRPERSDERWLRRTQSKDAPLNAKKL